MEACQQVLRDFETAGPSREDTESALRQVLLQLKDAKSDPEFWAQTLSELHLHGGSLDQISEWPDFFRRVADRGILAHLAQQYLSKN